MPRKKTRQEILGVLKDTDQMKKGCKRVVDVVWLLDTNKRVPAHYWYVWAKCKCDKLYKISYSNWIKGSQRHCGHDMALLGKQFYRLTPFEKTTEKSDSSYKWKCRCVCGNVCLVPRTLF